MFTTSIKDLYDNGIITEDDVDPGVFDSHVVSDGYVIRAELEPGTWGEVSCIQRVLDEPGTEEHLILIDEHGNSTNIGSSKVDIILYREMSQDELCM